MRVGTLSERTGMLENSSSGFQIGRKKKNKKKISGLISGKELSVRSRLFTFLPQETLF